MVHEGTYNSLLQGVSQQIPQEREDGQLGTQLNMLSDIVTGLRRRSGLKYLTATAESADCYIEVIELLGDTYIVMIDPLIGRCSLINLNTGSKQSATNAYYIATEKHAYRTTMAHNQYFIVNTEKVPHTINTDNTSSADLARHPHHFGYAVVLSSSFSRTFTLTLKNTSLGFDKTLSVTTSDTIANDATPTWVATKFKEAIQADEVLNANIEVSQVDHVLGFAMKEWASNFTQLTVDTGTSDIYMITSGSARAPQRTQLASRLPSALHDFIMAVGSVGNSAYYQYQLESRTWKEVGAYQPAVSIINAPHKWYIDNTNYLVESFMDLQYRKAGDADNNPDPRFLGYGITGIGSYQSRLVLLSGAYIHFSKTNEFEQYYRSTVTEVLDDDPIEISSASLASAQFEYCIPYNKDLILISQQEQAVVPANTSVLTPKNAVVYPSATADLSLRAKPTPALRTLYYVYQRGVDFYQVGEFVPSSYTDAQYQTQPLTDHIPMYAKGVCSCIATSTTNNMTVFTSDTNEVLVNEYLWVGDERPHMSFHKWEFPFPVVYATFQNDFLMLFLNIGGDITIGTLSTKTNQLDDKPAPYLDLYAYATTSEGEFGLPSHLFHVPKPQLDVAIYDNRALRHKSVQFDYKDYSVCTTPYEGTVAVGYKYKSEFSLTPPFIKNEAGKVIAGEHSIIHSLRMTFKHTGKFNVAVKDTYGMSYESDHDTALTWSEAALGYTWVNSVGSVVIPCRTRLSSTECIVSTDEATDLNLVTTDYVVRVAQKHRRLR